jgi:addiction module HigA family antidote
MDTEKREFAPLHPGRVLSLEFLEPTEMSGYRLARVLNTNEQRVYSVLRGERGISDDLAIRLGRLFDIEPEFFANLQAHYDLEMKKMEIGHQVEDEVKPLAPAREVLTPR